MKPIIPVSFETSFFPEVAIFANTDFTATTGGPTLVDAHLDSKLDVEPAEGSTTRFVAEHRISLDGDRAKTCPYRFNIVCVAVLEVDTSVPETERKRFAVVAAHAMTFPAIRELILTLTARQPWGQFNIGLSVLQNAQANQPPQVKGASQSATAATSKLRAGERKIAASTSKPKAKAAKS